MIQVSYNTEIISANRTLFRDEKISSVFFQNYGNTIVVVMDNIRIEPGGHFIWENQPVEREVVVIADNIQIVFLSPAPGVDADNRLLVTKMFYYI